MRTGLHCNTVANPAKVLDYYRRSGARVAKFLEFDAALFDQLKAMGVTLIGRVYFDKQPLGGTAATAAINAIVARAREYPQVDFWEGYNEEHAEVAEIGRFADWELARMRAFDDAGLAARCLLGCFSCGTPALPDDPDPTKRAAWSNFRPALTYALAHGHALALHEYSGPYMQWMCGENQWDFAANHAARIDDPCASPTVEGWLTMRYRKVWRQCLVPWGLDALPLFITEGGIDDVTPRPGGQGKGYKDFANTEWAHMPGIGDYADQRRWYQWQVSHDRFVHGVVDFGYLTADPAWSAFDLSTDTATEERLISAESSLPVGHYGDTNGGSMTEVESAALEAGRVHQSIQLFPGAGLQKAIAATGSGNGFWPTSNEFDFTSGGQNYIGQRAEHPRTGEVRVYYCPKPAYTPVKYVIRPS
jgi:hypothetical protein